MPSKSLFRGIGALVGEIPLTSVQPNPEASTAFKDFATLASYDLLPRQRKALVVPGYPSIWCPPAGPRKVEADEGTFLRDSNRYIFPQAPLEPLFRAILALQPKFKMNDIDIVADRRNLRLLLGFAAGQKKAFRIDLEVIKSTVLFTTRSPKTSRVIKGTGGYGHEVEDKWTKKPNFIRESVAHHRAVYYVFGGFKIILRFEVDACLGSLSDIYSPRAVTSKYRTPTGYIVFNQGFLVEPSRIIEIKTGRTVGRMRGAKNVAQLWFSKTPIMCIGRYTGDGLFVQARKMDLLQDGRLAQWEIAHREKLIKLIRVLEMVLEMVRAAPPGQYALVHTEGERILKLYGVAGKFVTGIPKDLLAMWNSDT